jgi:hypothetical protein
VRQPGAWLGTPVRRFRTASWASGSHPAHW